MVMNIQEKSKIEYLSRINRVLSIKSEKPTESSFNGQARADCSFRMCRKRPLGFTEFEQAWNTMCHWFVESGYQQGDGCTYEMYHNDYKTHPEQKHIVDICIPVKPL